MNDSPKPFRVTLQNKHLRLLVTSYISALLLTGLRSSSGGTRVRRKEGAPWKVFSRTRNYGFETIQRRVAPRHLADPCRSTVGLLETRPTAFASILPVIVPPPQLYRSIGMFSFNFTSKRWDSNKNQHNQKKKIYRQTK